MKKTKSLIAFETRTDDYTFSARSILCVDNVFKIKNNTWDCYIYYGIPGDAATDCQRATILWESSTAGVDVEPVLWAAIEHANNNPGSCELVDIPNSDGGRLYNTGISIASQPLPTE